MKRFTCDDPWKLRSHYFVSCVEILKVWAWQKSLLALTKLDNQTRIFPNYGLAFFNQRRNQVFLELRTSFNLKYWHHSLLKNPNVGSLKMQFIFFLFIRRGFLICLRACDWKMFDFVPCVGIFKAPKCLRMLLVWKSTGIKFLIAPQSLTSNFHQIPDLKSFTIDEALN